MQFRRDSGLATLLLVASAACGGALGCARSHDRPQAAEQDGDRGDAQQAFAEISVRVDSYDGFRDAISTAAPTPSTQSAYVFINEGRSEGRIPELRVFHGDEELREVSSAGSPPQFSYQGGDRPIGERAAELRFELGEESFSYPPEISGVDLVEPEKGAELTTSGEFRVRWSGAVPPALSITQIPGSTCEFIFSQKSRTAQEAVFAVISNLGGLRSCRADLSAEWELRDEPLTETPFASFAVTRHAKRIRRFLLSQLPRSGPVAP